MSENSAYQKLRGHLAYLRLAAAAEALPGELEHATKNKLGHSAFLERLLEVEVAATEQRRKAGLERFAALPAPWRLDDFDFDAQPSIDRKLVNELATLRFLEDATNVLFIGPTRVEPEPMSESPARALGSQVRDRSRRYDAMTIVLPILGSLLAAAVLWLWIKLVAFDRAHAKKPTSWLGWALFTLLFTWLAVPMLLVRNNRFRREDALAEGKPVAPVGRVRWGAATFLGAEPGDRKAAAATPTTARRRAFRLSR